MIKKNIKMMIITSIVILAPIIAGVLLWDQLPAQMATHFDSNGNPDGWSPKEFAVFGLPLLLLAVHWVCVAFTGQDPKNKNISDKMTILVLWICPMVSMLGSVITYMYTLDNSINNTMIAKVALGFIFVVIGNYMPKMKQSYTIGIKLPWTLESEENWYRTHRLAGYAFMVGGVLVAVTAFLEQVWITFVVFILMSVIPTLYSFILYKKGI